MNSDCYKVLAVLAELAGDEEFARALYFRGGGGRVAKYMRSRGVEQDLATVLSIAYSAGAMHALDWASRAIERVEKATRNG